MKLKDYLKQKQITQKKFSESLGIHYMHLQHILAGEGFPSRKLAKEIEQVTSGAVTVMELLYPNDSPDESDQQKAWGSN